MVFKEVVKRNDEKKILKGVKCRYIIHCGLGRHGGGIVAVVFEKDSKQLFWITEVNVASLRSFSEGEIYDISFIQHGDNKYIKNVKAISSEN